MSVAFMLKQVGAKTGLSPKSDSGRSTMLRWVNEASREIYAQCDPPGGVYEAVYKVNGDQTITCPANVGQIRGIREADSQIVWSINQMRPRYKQFNWGDSWRNVRLLNVRALMSTVTNSSIGVLTVGSVENPPVQVTVSGPTVNATSVSETVIMSQTRIETVNSYTDYTSVKKDRVNNFDIILSDVDGKLLTAIPNNQLAAQYQTIDVSLCPWLSTSQNPNEHYVELLFKLANTELANDSDEFIFGKNYDDVIVQKCFQLWYEEQGKADLALAFDAKATRTLARKVEDQNRATEDTVSLVANPHDELLPRVRSGRRLYRRGYGQRGFGY